MTTSHRDLALVDPWQRSLERSLHRRAITPAIRRSLARRRRASVALSTLMVAGPTGSLLAAAGFGLGGGRVEIAQASPASRAIDNGATPAAMAFELGSRGDAVAEIQRQLGVSADGLFGPLTHAAVIDFQARNGLDVDGIVGPATWTALFGLEQAAAAAGARDGSVAVILRERADAIGSGVGPSGADGGRDDDVDTGNGADMVGVGGDAPASTGSPGGDPAGGDGFAPRTRPVSTPAPGDGACGPLRLSDPVSGTVTSGFGPRWGRNHDGLDIAAATGTPIRAAECGIVSFAGVQSGYGNMVCVEHSSRFETCYAHMTRYSVSQGQRVEQGQVIGYVGCTGSCTGPHLHFETRVDGAARDPRPYLGGGSVPGAPTVKAALGPKAKAATAAAIAEDVGRARFAKTTTAVEAEYGTSWSHVGSQQPVASTGAPPPASPAPAATAPEPAPSTPASPGPTPAPAPVTPTYEAPQPTHSAPATTAPTPPAPEPVAPPTTPTPAPTPAPPPTPAPAPVVTAPTPTPEIAAPPVEPPPAPPQPAEPAPTTPAPKPEPAPTSP